MTDTPVTDHDARPLRADAQRNHDRILREAWAVFQELGPAASLSVIAQRAEVSPMTLYRHFPTREELVGAVIDLGIAELVEPAIASAMVAPDPWHALVDVLDAVVSGSTGSPQWRETITTAREWGLATEVAHDRILVPLEALVLRAQEAGVVRPDLALDDIPVVIRMLRAVVADGGSPKGLEHYVTMLLRHGSPT